MASRTEKWKGRIEGATDCCGVPGCAEPGEFRAPLSAGDFDGPGRWHHLCLEHVRLHNSRYNYFAGMSPDEITAAQSPIAGWERSTRAFTGGGDPPPPWRDFADPLDAIAARFRPETRGQAGNNGGERFTAGEREALGLMALDETVDRTALRQRYAALVRTYHPDRNGGDRSLEAKLQRVIEAYALLKGARGFA